MTMNYCISGDFPAGSYLTMNLKKEHLYISWLVIYQQILMRFFYHDKSVTRREQRLKCSYNSIATRL